MSKLAEFVGHRVRVRRVDIRMTQADLAKAIGIGQSYMSHLERGQKSMDLDLLEKISAVLECHPVDLLVEPQKVGRLSGDDYPLLLD